MLQKLDSLLTFPDMVFFIYYGLLRNGVKEKKVMEIKRRKNIKAKMPNMNSLFNTAYKEMNSHNEELPFFVRFVPTVVLAIIIGIIVIIVG